MIIVDDNDETVIESATMVTIKSSNHKLKQMKMNKNWTQTHT